MAIVERLSNLGHLDTVKSHLFWKRSRQSPTCSRNEVTCFLCEGPETSAVHELKIYYEVRTLPQLAVSCSFL